jgi:hypothetical protein
MIGYELREPHQKKPRASVWARPRGRTGALGMWGELSALCPRRSKGAPGQPSESTHPMSAPMPRPRPSERLRALKADIAAFGVLSVSNGPQRPSLRRLRGHTKKTPRRKASTGKQRARAGGQETARQHQCRIVPSLNAKGRPESSVMARKAPRRGIHAGRRYALWDSNRRAISKLGGAIAVPKKSPPRASYNASPV